MQRMHLLLLYVGHVCIIKRPSSFGRVEFASGGPGGPFVSKVNVEPCPLITRLLRLVGRLGTRKPV